MPALAAGSPFCDGRASGLLDTRLEVYRLNQRRVPEITGRVIPDRVASIDEYHGRILAPLYAAIAAALSWIDGLQGGAPEAEKKARGSQASS